MCKGLDDLINDGKEEGKLEGKAEKEIEIIKTMNSNGLTPEFIAKSLNLDINYVNKILQ